MIEIEQFRKLNLRVTWRLLYRGVCEHQIGGADIVEFAIEQVESGDDREDVCKLAALNPTEKNDMYRSLFALSSQEKTVDEIEDRKIRAVIVNERLKYNAEDYIEGLLELSELWVDLGIPNDSPFVMQADSDIEPDAYFTKSNYCFLYKKSKDWLDEELDYLRRNN